MVATAPWPSCGATPPWIGSPAPAAALAPPAAASLASCHGVRPHLSVAAGLAPADSSVA